VSGDRGKLRAGTYTLQRSMPYKDALAALTLAPKAAPTIDVTLPEGPSRRELAPRVPRPACAAATSRPASARAALAAHVRRAEGTKSLEGFLFPDTYQLRSRTRRPAARQPAAEHVQARVRQVDLKRARRNHLSRYDVLIIASMIEREARSPRTAG
jgi:cell division protein YceG involved in septum cleavage